jgi:DNA-binding response OmpR family regulator
MENSKTRLKVMVVGESKLIRRIVEQLMQNKLDVTCKADAAEVMNLFRKENYDVTLVDVYIRQVENICRDIKNLDRTYVALLTNGTPEDLSKVQSMNMDGYSYEDFNVPETVEKLQNIILRKKELQPKIKVLIVEDEIYIAKALTVSIKRRWPRAEVYHASCGKEGVRLAGLNPLDIILLDIKLPDINGFEVLGAIRSFSSTPIIMTTADKVQADVIKSLNSGANDYLIKPFTQEELINRIKKNLGLEQTGSPSAN